MYIRSTGLGKTLLKGKIKMLGVTRLVPSTLEESKDEQARMLIAMEVREPVHWEVRVFMESSDLRRMILLSLKPSTIFHGLKLLFSKSRKTVLQPMQDTGFMYNKKFAYVEKNGERPTANVPLSPAQKAALKKKMQKSNK